MRSLGDYRGLVPFEVIVADGALHDDSATRPLACDGVRIVRAEGELNLLGARNLGAERARGEHLFLLSSSTEVTES